MALPPKATADPAWRCAALLEVADIILGQSPPSSTYNTDKSGIAFLQGKAEFGPRHPLATKWCSEPAKLAPPNSVLVSVRAPVGDVNQADQKYCIGRGLAAVAPGPHLDADFLYFAMLTKQHYLASLGTGSTFQSINGNVLRTLEIPVPPLDEQRRIARILSTIQRAQNEVSDVRLAAEKVKAAVLAYAFTARQGNWIPLARVARVRASFPAPDRLQPTTQHDPDRILYLKVSDLSRANGIEVSDAVNVFRPNPQALAAGSIVFPKRGGAIATNVKRITLRPAVLDPNLIAVQPNPDVDARYLLGFFESIDLRSLQDNTPIPQLNKHNVESLTLPDASIEDRQRIARILTAIDRKISADHQTVIALAALFQSCITQLLRVFKA